MSVTLEEWLEMDQSQLELVCVYRDRVYYTERRQDQEKWNSGTADPQRSKK